VSCYQIQGEIRFLDVRDLPLLPMLRVLHQYPTFIPHLLQVDKGAIKHIFSGSHVMAPGLLTEGGRFKEGLRVNDPVAVMAEGKEHALAVGVMLMSSDEVLKERKGEAIQICGFMNDGLWLMKPI
jgi:PUA domain protein